MLINIVHLKGYITSCPADSWWSDVVISCLTCFSVSTGVHLVLHYGTLRVASLMFTAMHRNCCAPLVVICWGQAQKSDPWVSRLVSCKGSDHPALQWGSARSTATSSPQSVGHLSFCFSHQVAILATLLFLKFQHCFWEKEIAKSYTHNRKVGACS